MLLSLAVAGCATESRSPAPKAASPTPAREYRLVDDLCDRLDPAGLTTLTGIPTAETKYLPVRSAEDRHRRCWLSTADKEKAWVYTVQVDIRLDDAANGPDQELTPRGPERAVKDLGDHAVIHIAETLAMDNPVREGQQVQSQTGTLMVVQGPVRFHVRWTGGGTALAVADVEALLLGYARQTLELVGG
ncbi:hypothetical protein [Micromonospora pallida]|nr:hypothetical protein [Micromonospora pallida]